MFDKTILVVDDEPRTRKGLSKTLENWSDGKYKIIPVADANAAIEVVENEKVHVLITDIRMPEISGLRLIELLKKQNQLPVVIVISAYSEFEYAQEALRFGVVNYLLKPISKQKLIETVEEAIEVEEKQEWSGILEKVVDSELLDIKLNKDSRYSPPIKEALDYVEAHYDKEISLKDVAEHVHLNASYFSALFKEQTQLTFSEYLTRYRMQLAKKLLITSQLPITEIAERVGYKTSKYFIKLFKYYEGTTPNSYRKENESAIQK